MNAAVLVPLSRELSPARCRAWSFVRSMLWLHDWPVVTGESDGAAWSKGAALHAARAQTEAGVLVVMDADVLPEPEALRWAVASVEQGAAWAVPHTFVYRLDESSTDELLRTGSVPASPGLTRLPYRGILGGGCTVVSAAAFDNVGGVDPRFIGWGGEDEAFGWALRCLHGPPLRSDAPLHHLWHEHAAPKARRPPRPESATLRNRYRAARRTPRLMRAVIDEAR